MARPKKQANNEEFGWAICAYHPDGTCGWLVDGKSLNVKTYASPEEAEKALKLMKRDTRYSWNSPMEIKEFKGFSNKKG